MTQLARFPRPCKLWLAWGIAAPGEPNPPAWCTTPFVEAVNLAKSLRAPKCCIGLQDEANWAELFSTPGFPGTKSLSSDGPVSRTLACDLVSHVISAAHHEFRGVVEAHERRSKRWLDGALGREQDLLRQLAFAQWARATAEGARAAEVGRKVLAICSEFADGPEGVRRALSAAEELLSASLLT